MFEQLQSDFEVGWKNIKTEEFVGYSGGYHPKQTAVGTTNGAGAHNVQTFFLASDLTVLHALPGFWHPEDFARELRFAKVVAKLWADQSKTRAQKERMLTRMHRREVYVQPAETYARSTWQGFDAHMELRKAKTQFRDTILRDQYQNPVLESGQPVMKPLNVLAHERASKQLFVPFDEFDVEALIDYGKMHYDLNRGHDKGKTFSGQKTLARKRARDERRKRKRG